MTTCRAGLLLCPRAPQYARPNRLAGSVQTLSQAGSSNSTAHSRSDLDRECKSCTATTVQTITARRRLAEYLRLTRHRKAR